MALKWQHHVAMAGAASITLYLMYRYYLRWMLYPVFYAATCVLCAAMFLFRGKYKLRGKETQPKPPTTNLESVFFRMKTYRPDTLRPTMVSANVDARIEKVLELTLRHHVLPLYRQVLGEAAEQETKFFNNVAGDVWRILRKCLDLVSQVDTHQLISRDTLQLLREHFEHFHGLQLSLYKPKFPDLDKFPYLESAEKETEFLRQAVKVLFCVCLPREYLENPIVRTLMREYLVCQVLKPIIERVCDPDYINQNLVMYLVKQEEAMQSSGSKGDHSETYEEFMGSIRRCEDVEELTRIRQFIITEILQAKAVQRMKEVKSTSFRVISLPVSVSADKAKSLMGRSDLKQYVTQLTTAKGVCERQIKKYGGEDYYQEQHLLEPEKVAPDYPRPIPFDTIMLNDTAFMYFLKYMESEGFGNFVIFWKEVQDMGALSGEDKELRIKEILRQYLVVGAERSIFLQNLDLVREIEENLLFDIDHSHEVLCKIQQSVYDELHDHFYQYFIRSAPFMEFMDGEADAIDITRAPRRKCRSDTQLATSPVEENAQRQRLKILKKKLSERDSVLASLTASTIVQEPAAASTSYSTTSTARMKRMEKGRSEIQEEITQLQRYIEHTEEWFGTVGYWSVEVVNVDTSEEEGNDKDPLVVIIVRRPDADTIQASYSAPSSHRSHSTTGNSSSSWSDPDTEIISLSTEGEEVPKHAGWVIGRRVSEFHQMHGKLRQIQPRLAFPPTPKKSVFTLIQRKETEKKYWDQYKQAIQSYLNTIVRDVQLQESEYVFNFLSPAAADIKTKKSDPKDDPILEHVSALVSEIFELQERSRVLRRQLYELVQLTYGKSIEGEIQDFIKWLLSEPMLVHYLETFQDSMWPDGKPVPPTRARSKEAKEMTKSEAMRRFMKSAPQTLQTILGERNCQIGFLKIFSALQDPKANKQLFYSVFECFLYLLVPELRDIAAELAAAADSEKQSKAK